GGAAGLDADVVAGDHGARRLRVLDDQAEIAVAADDVALARVGDAVAVRADARVRGPALDHDAFPVIAVQRGAVGFQADVVALDHDVTGAMHDDAAGVDRAE